MCGGCGSAPAADWAGELLRTPADRGAAARAVERWCAAAGTRVAVAWSPAGWCARWPTGRTDVAGSLTELWRALDRRGPLPLPDGPDPGPAPPGGAPARAVEDGVARAWPPALPGRRDVVLALDVEGAVVGSSAAVLDELAPGASLVRVGDVHELRAHLDACAADPVRRSTAVAAAVRIGPGPAWLADTRLRGGRLVPAQAARSQPGAPARQHVHRGDPADLPVLVAWMTGLHATGAGAGRSVTVSCGTAGRVELSLVDGRALPARCAAAEPRPALLS